MLNSIKVNEIIIPGMKIKIKNLSKARDKFRRYNRHLQVTPFHRSLSRM